MQPTIVGTSRGSSGTSEIAAGVTAGAMSVWGRLSPPRKGCSRAPAEKAPQLRFEKRRVLHLTLPEDTDPQPEAPELAELSRVPVPVVPELPHPELTVGRGNRRQWTVPVMVPETAVHEKRPSPRAIGEIGAPGQRGHVSPVAAPELSQGARNPFFQIGLALPDTLHQRTALRRAGRGSFARHFADTSSRAAGSPSDMRSRCARTRSRKPGGKRRELRAVRDRNPAVARLESGIPG